MLGYVVFILNIGGFTMGMRAPFIIGLISTLAFFSLTIRDGYNILINRVVGLLPLPSTVILDGNSPYYKKK